MARLKEIAIGRGGDSFLFDPAQIQEKPGYNVRDMDSPERGLMCDAWPMQSTLEGLRRSPR